MTNGMPIIRVIADADLVVGESMDSDQLLNLVLTPNGSAPQLFIYVVYDCLERACGRRRINFPNVLASLGNIPRIIILDVNGVNIQVLGIQINNLQTIQDWDSRVEVAYALATNINRIVTDRRQDFNVNSSNVNILSVYNLREILGHRIPWFIQPINLVENLASSWRQLRLRFRDVLNLSLGLILGVYLHANLNSLNSYFSSNWCDNFALNDNLSCGEEIIFNQQFGLTPSASKQQGVEAFHKHEYEQAYKLFEQARKEDKNDAETLIYWENSKLLLQKRETYTIAVVAPLTTDTLDIAEAVLRGAAQAQKDFNEAQTNLGLIILIVNDNNDPLTAANIAKNSISKDDVIAVVGHFPSEVTQKALPVYQQKGVVLMNYASTAPREKLNKGNNQPNIFFRIPPTDAQVNIPALINELHLKSLANREKVAVFYTKGSIYSQSFLEDLQDKLGANKIIPEDLSDTKFIPAERLQQVQKKGAKALILVPDGLVNTSPAEKNAFSLINQNQDEFPIGTAIDLPNTALLNNPVSTQKLLIVTPWHRLTSPQANQQVRDQVQKFLVKAQETWRTDKVSALTAMSYDATLVLTEAIKKLPVGTVNKSLPEQRLALRQKLTRLKIIGASGSISFDNKGDRQEKIYRIVRVVPVSTDCSKYGAIFVPIDYPEEQAKKLDCKRRYSPP